MFVQKCEVADHSFGQPLGLDIQTNLDVSLLIGLGKVCRRHEHSFGIDDAKPFLERLKELYDKYAVLLGPEASEADAIALLTSEIFDRLDAQTYGLR